jgi:hypothetical protein
MARPRVINPEGEVVKLSVILKKELADELRAEAKSQQVTLGEVMRRRLASTRKGWRK